MIARSFGKGSLAVSNAAAGMTVTLGENTSAIHVFRGRIGIEAGELASSDTWIAALPGKTKVTVSDDALLAVVSIVPVRDA
jgi:hypothetical protein